MMNFLKRILGTNKAWWVEIKTDGPTCTYFFGPFEVEAEAEAAKAGYVEDLEGENAQNIRVALRHCKAPDALTVFDYASDSTPPVGMPAFSGQP